MASTTLRVHSLAKELGVPSKAVIDKCRAEGIELKNHMAAISVGLAESIREWFSAGDDVTSVEVADRVDVSQIRRPPPRSEAAAHEGADHEGAVGVEIAEDPTGAVETEETLAIEETVAEEEAQVVTEPTAEVAETTEPAPPVVAETEAVSSVAEEAPVVPMESGPTEPAPLEPLAPAASAASAAPSAPAPPKREERPVKPVEPVRPAGPQVVPAPAELKGPTLVRIEAPEPHRVPRPRQPRPAGDAQRVAPAAAGAAPSTAARGKRGKPRKGEEEEGKAVRSRSPRRHGSAVDVDQRLREWRDQDLLERKERLASVTGHGLRDRKAAERRRQQASTGSPQALRKDPVLITTPIAIKDYCAAVGVGFAVISKKLMEQTGRLWMINQNLDAEQAELLAMELGLQIQVAKSKTAYERLQDMFAQRERKDLRPRPPVVAMLGHVDHGKTSLLDAIRATSVAEGEAGGITQHIGAYRIDKGDWHVTFVDTPGHQAFTEMRARGANLTDVVVLVVAADDGVMPQTVEAINHARAAGVAIVIALNKIDLPGVDLNRIYAQLATQELTPTEWGGHTDVIKTSAVSREGIDELIAHLSTLSELMELQADPTVPAQATVIESQMRGGQGAVAKVLVREGTLRPGQCVVCGPAGGRIRALRDDRGRMVKEATPGTPVEVSGLDEMPSAGDQMYEVGNLSEAKVIAEEVREERRAASLETVHKPRTLEALMLGEAEAEVPQLNVIVKADVQGSVEVLRSQLGEFPAEKARLNVLHAAVGAVSEADVQLARASGALVISFNVVPEERARQLAERLGVEVREYRVIYELLDDLHKALAGLLAPIEKEERRGAAEVRQVFNISRVGTIAGCLVTDGIVARNHRARLVRDGRVITENKTLASLKRFKDDAREVRAGLECGIKLEGFDDLKPGDAIHTYEIVEVSQEL